MLFTRVDNVRDMNEYDCNLNELSFFYVDQINISSLIL